MSGSAIKGKAELVGLVADEGDFVSGVLGL
jgi:hypothetical protein